MVEIQKARMRAQQANSGKRGQGKFGKNRKGQRQVSIFQGEASASSKYVNTGDRMKETLRTAL